MKYGLFIKILFDSKKNKIRIKKHGFEDLLKT